MKLPPVLSSRHKEAIFLMKRMLCVLLMLLLWRGIGTGGCGAGHG